MDEKLKKYNQKRNFEKTDEPAGKIEKSRRNLKFVVQHHIASRDHYDFRLEWNGTLLSWAVPKGPSFCTNDKRLAVRVEDHPYEYRNFEGNIPKGEYGGGTVMIWDEGYWIPSSDAEKGLMSGSLKFTLNGKRLKGKWALVQIKDKANSANENNNWLLIKEKDEFALDTAGISQYDTSIRTNRTMEEIAHNDTAKNKTDGKMIKNPFIKADVQLAQLMFSLPQGGNWLYELKYDGYRILAYIEAGKAKLVSRNGNDYTANFKVIADTLAGWARDRAMVLDGEMVIADENGKTDFQALQNYLKNPDGNAPVYIVFDLLALDGEDLRENTLIKRKSKLKNIMQNAPKNLHFSEYTDNIEKESFKNFCELGFEGLIGKKADSIYSGTRNGDWIKIKCESRQEFVIGGYTISEKKSAGVSSILLGYFEGKDLIYAGRSGTGFSESIQKDLEKKFKKIYRKNSPFKTAPKIKSDEQLFWLEPQLLAEIKFLEWTNENILRQASFKGVRGDKDIFEITKENITKEDTTKEDKESMDNSEKPIQKKLKSPVKKDSNSGENIIGGVVISNPQKLLFQNPQISKSDLAQYYQKAAKRMMPYIHKRIMSLVCCPGGAPDSCFFKKHSLENIKGIVKVPVKNSRNEDENYFYIDETSGLLSLVQMNTIEFHIWGSSADNLEKPDIMVFDLDPDEGMDLKNIRQGVTDLKSILEKLSLKSYLKTSGGKGYHVVVPFGTSADWETFNAFARNITEIMEQKWPDRYTSNVRKIKRKGKIFIDWIRNGRGATSIAPYSVRARDGARVSMPIEWNELDTIAPDDITMEKALKRLEKKDPWNDFFETKEKQRLK